MIRNKKSSIIMSIIVIVLLLGLGYAYLNSNLSINSTVNVTSATWDVHWNNVNVVNGSVTGEQVTTPATIQAGLTEVLFNVTLKEPGDYYEFTVDAVNNGSIDVMIDSFSNKVFQSNGITERTKPSYLNFIVTYDDGVPLESNHLLAANTTETYKVIVEFRTDINPSDLPSTNDSMIFKFGVTYIQSNSNAINKPNYVYTVNMHPTKVTIGSAIPNNVTVYNTYQEAVTAFGHNVFLAHVLENNIVTESYVGFVYNNNAYYLRAAGATYNSQTGMYNNDSPYYENNKATLQGFFGSNNCFEDVYEDARSYYCLLSNVSPCVENDGYVYVINFDDYTCRGYSDGTSACSFR